MDPTQVKAEPADSRPTGATGPGATGPGATGPGPRPRVGVWLVGARGSVATTVVTGASAMRVRLVPPVGMVGETAEFAGVGLPSLDDLVFGGHDVASTPLPKRAAELAQAGVVPARLVSLVEDELAAADTEIRDGAGGPLREHEDQATAARRLADDISSFRDRHELRRVVVVNVSSTEPRFAAGPEHQDPVALGRALRGGRDVLPPSSLYAYAAIQAGCPFVDFTPSTGMRLPALGLLARERALPYAGSDGKTGETLLRSALAPMFTGRALRVLAWSGTNLLGGGDGATLADPLAAASKTTSKGQGLRGMLGHRTDGDTRIDYVPALGDWKTAWDHVLFEGFLGVRMTMQVTWQGCDSALAAPLVLDLARFAAHAHEAGCSGPLGALGYYFKDPLGTTEYRLPEQYRILRDWACALGGPAGAA
ncbi:inositol-3-phosphate synthase [Parafrankia elaeagni]|uniref:inositol-3-phosphate synthase n=1 Tax=Parafrankia elaeagni TaxID=222534 RepID=UPI000371AD8E|nr:inositol-3-phosphate synthase [Parafrankia elaeagni]